MTPRLVIFDCDGVLVDSEPITNAVISENLTRHGFALEPQEAINLFAGGTMKSVGEEAQRRGAKLPETWLEEIYAEIYARLREGVPVVPGVISLIDRLHKAGVATAVASNGAPKKMEITLTPSGLYRRLAGRLYSGQVHAAAKPAPGLLHYAMNIAGVSAEETIMIDDMPAGCLAARSAGVRCLGFVPIGEDPARLADTGARVVRDMNAVAEALEMN